MRPSVRLAVGTGEANKVIVELDKERGELRRLLIAEIREAQRIEAEKRVTEEEQSKLKSLLFERPGRSSSYGKSGCLPGTRMTVLTDLITWAKGSSEGGKRLFWLHGVAGCGKSAVAASIFSLLMGEVRAGAFFCSRDEAEGRNPTRLLNT